MSWFGSNLMDELVEKATSPDLPAGSEDLALNLDICDRIRSKAVPAKDAMRSLKKRIGHKNPNVQLLALTLTDLCVKNGGSHFLVEISSREFVDNLVSLLNSPATLNFQVKGRILELVQTWALAFEGRSELGYMSSTYQHLKQDGFQFPPEERLAASFVDTAAPPDWSDSEVCMRCRTAFTFTNRKHHCRSCGNVFCGQCSTQTMPLPQLGITTPVRVCDGCFAKKQQPQQQASSRKAHSNASAPSPSKTQRAPREEEDLDLKRALELSLAESTKEAQQKPQPAPVVRQDEEDDADLKAAIEASLRESQAQEAQAPAPTNGYNLPILTQTATQMPQPYAANTVQAANAQEPPSANPFELQPSEAENINLFATLVDRLKSSDVRSGILRDAQIQELYESISSLRAKLSRSLGNAVGKYESLVETHSKLATVQKYYDRLLEARLASTYDTRGPSYGAQLAQGYGHEDAGYYGAPAAADYYTQGPPQSQGYARQPQYQQHPEAYYQSGHVQKIASQPEARKEEVSLIDL